LVVVQLFVKGFYCGVTGIVQLVAWKQEHCKDAGRNGECGSACTFNGFKWICMWKDLNFLKQDIKLQLFCLYSTMYVLRWKNGQKNITELVRFLYNNCYCLPILVYVPKYLQILRQIFYSVRW